VLMNDESESAPETAFLEQETNQEEPPLTVADAPSPPPTRACMVCGQRAWRWNAASAGYECAGAPEIHAEYEQWSRVTFSWLHGEKREHEHAR
jgi:hypothetical protein